MKPMEDGSHVSGVLSCVFIVSAGIVCNYALLLLSISLWS